MLRYASIGFSETVAYIRISPGETFTAMKDVFPMGRVCLGARELLEDRARIRRWLAVTAVVCYITLLIYFYKTNLTIRAEETKVLLLGHTNNRMLLVILPPRA